MPTQCQISIVMPTYNGASFLNRTLKSIQNQTFTNWECVIINDGSSDATPNILKAFASTDHRFRVFEQENQGVSISRNNGLAKTYKSSGFIVFMDHDDLYQPHALETLLKACQNNPECIGAHGLADLIDIQDDPIDQGGYADWMSRRLRSSKGSVVECHTSQPTSFENILFKSIYPPGALITRRNVIEQVGLMDPQFPPSEDFDYFLRCSRHGNYAFINQIILGYRRHSHNLSNSTKLAHRKTRAILHKAYYSHENKPHHKKTIRCFYRAIQTVKMRAKQKQLLAAVADRNARDLFRMPVHLTALTIRYLWGKPIAWL